MQRLRPRGLAVFLALVTCCLESHGTRFRQRTQSKLAQADTSAKTIGNRTSTRNALSVYNVLLIVVDDLRTEIGAYGRQSVRTPNIDRLASTGTLFQRAYVQYALCAPSRTSFMTGRRPDATRAWSESTHFRQVGEKWTSLPEYFKHSGYLTLGSGKMFHPRLPPKQDTPRSWDSFTIISSSCRGMKATNFECKDASLVCPNEVVDGGRNDMALWCVSSKRARFEKPLHDEAVAELAVGHLRQGKAANLEGRPFFVGVGFIGPHVPWHWPEEFTSYVPMPQISLPTHREPPEKMPFAAWHQSPEQWGNLWKNPIDKNRTRLLRWAYAAAVSYLDEHVGKVLDELEALQLDQTTAVVLMGDNGFHLGEANMWQKMTNFELDTRVPLIFRVPWAQRAGTATPAIVEAIDVFPTLVEVAGLPPVAEALNGTSFANTIANPPLSGTGAKHYAFSQHARCWGYSPVLNKKMLWDVCLLKPRFQIPAMGYSVRSDGWRFTQWVAWDGNAPIWTRDLGSELYDHRGDFGRDLDRSTPTKNVVAEPENAAIVATLKAVLRQQVDNGFLPLGSSAF